MSGSFKELLGSVGDLGGRQGLVVFGQPTTGDYLMLQTQAGDIPLFLSFSSDPPCIKANAKVGDRWTTPISAAVPRLRDGELLEIELRFSLDSAEIWIARALYLHMPMPFPPTSSRRLFGAGDFSYAALRDIESEAPANHGRIISEVATVKPSDGEWTFDLGMGDGDEAEEYLRRGTKVLAIEPNAVAVAHAARRFADYLESGQLVVWNAAVASDDGFGTLFVNTGVARWSSTIEDIARREFPCIPVPVSTIRMATLVEAYGYPVCVICSTEGSNNLVLDAISQWPKRPQHLSLSGCDEGGLQALANMGYQRFRLATHDAYNLAEPGSASKNRKRTQNQSRSNGIWLTVEQARTSLRGEDNPRRSIGPVYASLLAEYSTSHMHPDHSV